MRGGASRPARGRAGRHLHDAGRLDDDVPDLRRDGAAHAGDGSGLTRMMPHASTAGGGPSLLVGSALRRHARVRVSMAGAARKPAARADSSADSTITPPTSSAG